MPDGTKLYMRRRVSIGMPVEMREAVEQHAEKTGASMSEVGRSCLFRNLMRDVYVPRKAS